MLPAFSWQAVFTQWEFAPVVTAAVALAAALYLWGMVRVARRHPARPWSWWPATMFFSGLAVVVIATESGIGAYDDVLFWDHMIQHLMLIMVAPVMLVAGQPFSLLLHASRNPLHSWAKRVMRSRVVSFLTWPVFGLAAYAVTIIGTHLTGLVNLVILNPVIHAGEHVLYLIVGFLFFLPLVGREPIRWRPPYPVKILILAVSMPIDTFTGVILGYANTGFASAGPRPPGAPSPVDDAHLGGAVMWIGGDAIMLVLMMLVFLAWSRQDRGASLGLGWLEAARSTNFDGLVAARQAESAGGAAAAGPVVAADDAVHGTATGAAAGAGRGKGRRGTIDDEEHLAAYNAYLARLNASGHRPSGTAEPGSTPAGGPRPPGTG